MEKQISENNLISLNEFIDEIKPDRKFKSGINVNLTTFFLKYNIFFIFKKKKKCGIWW